MKLIAFSVHNYRSITSTPRIELSNLTVLVGPNNEGKSNLLSALVCALSLAQEVRFGLRRTTLTSRMPYVFHRDFPVALQSNVTSQASKFMLEFELDEADKSAFKEAVGSKLNGTLRIQLSVTKDGDAGFTVIKQGPAQKTLSAKRQQIAVFISERLRFQYIGALRSEEQSRDIVETMVSRALTALESNEDYQKGLKLIEDAERPLLESVSRTVEDSLKPFLPALRSVSTQVSKEQRTRALRRSVEVWLDDGTATALSQKGDGVKSLVAIALAKAAAETSAGSKNLMLAIEEPEAHLHSGAIHALKTLLENVAAQRQVIISTHEPALVRRDVLGANILVENNRARPAQSLEELRRVLGVQLGENLVSPDLVVLVEGPNDAALLRAVASNLRPALQAPIGSGRLVFQPLNGAGNLPHQLRFYQSLVCNALAFLDDDIEGNNAFAKVKNDGLLDGSGVFMSSRPGNKESELEDLVEQSLYSSSLLALLGVSKLRPKSSAAQKSKWSARIEAALQEQGKPKADIESLISRAKQHVNEVATANAAACFIPGLIGPIEGLLDAVIQQLGLPAQGTAGG